VLAVAKAAVAEQLAKLDEAVFHIAAADMAEAEFADAGRVDQVAAAREVSIPKLARLIISAQVFITRP